MITPHPQDLSLGHVQRRRSSCPLPRGSHSSDSCLHFCLPTSVLLVLTPHTQNHTECALLHLASVVRHSACEIYPCCPVNQQLIVFTSVSSVYQYITFDLCILLVMGIWVISSLGPLEVNILVRDFGFS